VFEECCRTQHPTGDFEDEDPGVVVASYEIYKNLARMHFDAAMLADATGHWEKAVDYFRRAGDLLVAPTEKIKVAYPKFTEGYQNEKKRYIEELEARADETKALEAKDQASYTNEDYTALEHVLVLRNGIKVADESVAFYTGRIERADKDIALYQTLASTAQENTKGMQEQISKYKLGTVKWVEAIVTDHRRQMVGYTAQEDKMAFVSRLMVLSPTNKKAPVLLEWLKGNITEAELNRAIPARSAGKKN
jgi:hypothetical protein